MPTFAYEALDASGKPRKGEIDAGTSDEAITKIKSQGFFPTSVRERKSKGGPKTEAAKTTKRKKKKGEISINIGRVKVKTLTQFTRQLSTLQDAGRLMAQSKIKQLDRINAQFREIDTAEATVRLRLPQVEPRQGTAVRCEHLAIGYPDLVSIANTAINQTGQAVEGIAIIMAVYLTISLTISVLMNWYNARMALRGL